MLLALSAVRNTDLLHSGGICESNIHACRFRRLDPLQTIRNQMWLWNIKHVLYCTMSIYVLSHFLPAFFLNVLSSKARPVSHKIKTQLSTKNILLLHLNHKSSNNNIKISNKWGYWSQPGTEVNILQIFNSAPPLRHTQIFINIYTIANKSFFNCVYGIVTILPSHYSKKRQADCPTPLYNHTNIISVYIFYIFC